jgi:hypothetical protein
MTEQRMKRIYCIITMLIAAVLLLLPQTAGAQKNIKLALALSKDLPGVDFINGTLVSPPIEGRTPASRQRWPNSMDVY